MRNSAVNGRRLASQFVKDHFRAQVKLVNQEVVRGLGFNAPRLRGRLRKVPGIERDDHLRPRLQSRRSPGSFRTAAIIGSYPSTQASGKCSLSWPTRYDVSSDVRWSFLCSTEVVSSITCSDHFGRYSLGSSANRSSVSRRHAGTRTLHRETRHSCSSGPLTARKLRTQRRALPFRLVLRAGLGLVRP